MEIIICKRCKGIGTISLTVENMKTDEPCWECGGTGKQSEHTFKMIVPYGKDVSKVENKIKFLIEEGEK